MGLDCLSDKHKKWPGPRLPHLKVLPGYLFFSQNSIRLCSPKKELNYEGDLNNQGA